MEYSCSWWKQQTRWPATWITLVFYLFFFQLLASPYLPPQLPQFPPLPTPTPTFWLCCCSRDSTNISQNPLPNFLLGSANRMPQRKPEREETSFLFSSCHMFSAADIWLLLASSALNISLPHISEILAAVWLPTWQSEISHPLLSHPQGHAFPQSLYKHQDTQRELLP